MTTLTLTSPTASAFVQYFFRSDSFRAERKALGQKMPEFCSRSGRGARIIAAREGQVELFADGVRRLISSLTPYKTEAYYDSIWSLYVYDDQAYKAWAPTCADRLIGAEIEFFGFEFSTTFRAEIERAFGVKIADTKDEAEFKRLRPRGLEEAAGTAQSRGGQPHPGKGDRTMPKLTYRQFVAQQVPGWSSVLDILDFEGESEDATDLELIADARRNLVDLIAEAQDLYNQLCQLEKAIDA